MGNGKGVRDGEVRVCRFGTFELDVRAGELRRNGLKVRLQEQPFQVLALLLETPGQIVTREELRNRLWPADTFVDFDHSLNAAIKRLRDALGDSAENPTFIETIARRGYRFLAPVSSNGSSGSMPAGSATAPAAASSHRHYLWLLAAGVAVVLLFVGIKLGTLLSTRHPAHLRVTRLTSTPVDDRVRASMISRDGKYLAYADESAFYVQQIDTGETRPVSLPPGLQVDSGSWLPDSVHLLVSLRRGAEKLGIWQISVLGGEPRQVSQLGRFPVASPDGKRIGFVQGDWLNEEIWIMSADGSDARKVSGSLGQNFGNLAWSPDGTAIAFDKGSLAMGGWGINGSLEILFLESSREPETLLSSTGLSPSLVWAADNRLIYSKSEPVPNQADANLWSLQLDSNKKPVGASVRLTHDSGYIAGISLSTEKGRLAVLRQFLEPEVFVARLGPGLKLAEPRRLTLDDRGDLPFAWTSDSKQVIFVSNRTGTYSIFRQGIDQTVPEAVVKGPPSAGLPRLTPDGKDIVYLTHPSAGEEIGDVTMMRASLMGGSPQKILNSPDLGNHQCARLPSTVCIYNDLTKEGMTFWYFDPIKGRGDQLLKTKAVNWSLSGDGQFLAIAESAQGANLAQVRFISLRGGKERNFSLVGCLGIPNVDWAADSKSVWSVCHTGQDGAESLSNVDLSGRIREVWKTSWLWLDWAIPSPDGHYLALSKGGGTANVWMVENF